MPGEFPDSDSRVAFRPFMRPQNQLPADQRLFGLLGGGGGLFGGGGGITVTTTTKKSGLIKTKTVASLLQTTFTSTKTIFCVSPTQLISPPMNCNGRRRREVALLDEMVEEFKQQYAEKERFLRSLIEPHPVEMYKF